MSYLYQAGDYFAQIADGLEELGAEELLSLGATEARPVYRGIHFKADTATLYRIVYASRLASRVLAPLADFPCHDSDRLYKQASRLDWGDFLDEKDTFAVFANVHHSRITHSRFAALRLKDAVVDQFRDRTGRRPSIDTHAPSLWLGLYVEQDRAVLSVDCGGGPLHRRGYRRQSVEAPMQETLAAAVIRLSEWDGERPLCDPMCGSGTLLCEALLSWCRIPPAWQREKFGFKCLPDYDFPLWKQIKHEVDIRRRELPTGLLAGGDVLPAAARVARVNLKCVPGGERVPIAAEDFRAGRDLTDRTIVCNPPYGIRLGRGQDLGGFYRELGDFFKRRCTGSTAYVFFGDRKYLKSIGLRPAWRKPLSAGGLDARLARFDLY